MVGKRGGIPSTAYEDTYDDIHHESDRGMGYSNCISHGDTDANSNTDSGANSDEYAAAYDYSHAYIHSHISAHGNTG